MRNELYEPARVRSLFNEMAATYGVVNMISSVGYCQRWRSRCVGLAPIEPGMVVCDLMTGMGECWGLIARRLGGSGRIIGIDFSADMCARARQQQERLRPLDSAVLEEDVLENSLASASVDCVVSSFGLKTLTAEGKHVLARQVRRILRPGGSFSLLEISVPPSRMLVRPYLAYLRYGVPVFGRLFLGNPDNYRLLATYTERFRDVSFTGQLFREEGMVVHQEAYLFGCATAIHGLRP